MYRAHINIILEIKIYYDKSHKHYYNIKISNRIIIDLNANIFILRYSTQEIY